MTHSRKEFLSRFVVMLLFAAPGVAFISCKGDTTTQYITASTGDAKWHEVGKLGEPAFKNSWTNYDTVSYSTCAFRKDGQNFVTLKGTAAGGTENTIIFTLPAGCRPSQLLMFNPYGGTFNSNVSVDSAGNVIKGPNYVLFASLDGIIFHADR